MERIPESYQERLYFLAAITILSIPTIALLLGIILTEFENGIEILDTTKDIITAAAGIASIVAVWVAKEALKSWRFSLIHKHILDNEIIFLKKIFELNSTLVETSHIISNEIIPYLNMIEEDPSFSLNNKQKEQVSNSVRKAKSKSNYAFKIISNIIKIDETHPALRLSPEHRASLDKIARFILDIRACPGQIKIKIFNPSRSLKEEYTGYNKNRYKLKDAGIEGDLYIKINSEIEKIEITMNKSWGR
jgi:hypothetical protein